ncbi:hypothetical protein BT96DRAFT_959311 [Gymnopus androsaceus JB14]|uniref:Helitron helicase-like domain-containing protein n=1 Tax=Gymnopus androsaceus JB14 TaxID=1447944 RepID=A0A6A4H5W5_9AGAR|nr:hypothetical protein BT96DRAFT_959311 [Gymnopus androsaceus JB14]
MTSAAIHKLAVSSTLKDAPADFILQYEHDPISEYNNPGLFPGMFPTLYPLGIGGFEDPSHLLDQSNCTFRYHYFYSFVILNIIQRQKAHLHTSLSHIALGLLSVSASTLSALAAKIKDKDKMSTYTEDEQRAFHLLKEVNTVSAKIPGSQASKITLRQEIHSYYAYFGLPQLFLTLNPSAIHNPVFQVIYECAYRVAKDPVAAADFFKFMIETIFRNLFGWNYKKGQSNENGGIFGHLRANSGTKQL